MEELKDEFVSINMPKYHDSGNSVILVHYKISKVEVFRVP